MPDAAPQEPLKPAFRRASDELPELGRDVIVRFANKFGGGMREACRMPIELLLQNNLLPAEIDPTRELWGSENGDMSYIRDDDEWIYAEEYAESPEDTLKLTAGALLQAARDLRDLSSGVLERRDGLDRAARVASIRSTDAFAFVASLFTDGRLGAEVEADFRKHFPDFDIDHDELIGLQDLREQMKAAIASGMVSPFVNMEEPPPARDDAAELRAAIREWVEATDDAEAFELDQTNAYGTDHADAEDRVEAAVKTLRALAATEGRDTP